MHHAGPFAQYLHGTCTSAACAQNIRIEDGARRATEIAAGDLLDEARHIDMGGTSGSTGRIEAKETSICLGHGGLPVKRWMQVAEALCHLRLNDDLLMERRSLAHLESITFAHSKRLHRMEDNMILLIALLYFGLRDE